MSSGQMHHPYPYQQPRYPRTASQTPSSQILPYQAEYNNNSGSVYHSFPNQSRQPNFDSGFRFPYNMPGYSSLTNSALVDAVLTPNTNEQEQERQDFSLAASSRGPPSQMKRSRPFAHDSPPLSELSGEDGVHGSQRQSAGLPSAGPRKQQKRKFNAPSELEDEYIDGDESDDFTNSHPARRPRRSNRARKSQASLDFANPDDYDFSSPVKETRSKRPTPAKRPRKERPGRLIRKKPIGTPVPKTLAEAGPPDRMMWQWKNQGRNWEEIRAEWKRMTGIEPGGSSLSVRYIKLVENLARNGAAGDLELLRFKKEAEEELLSQVWFKVAEKMVAFSPESEHNPRDLQKRYNMIVRSGYDVEQLLADDEQQREAEQKHNASSVQIGENEEDFDMDFDGIAAYDNPVANETAASLRQGAMKHTHAQNIGSRYEEELPAVSEDPVNIFDPCRRPLRTEVDGLNERRQYGNARYQSISHQQPDSMISTTLQTPSSPLASMKGDFNGHNETLPAMASGLVGYNSDSE